ncbi:MAG: mandelate racemase [Xanthobacteraceae bacterium]|nr:mandelate racemase [Xanthobacteraceae bacterium]MBV9627243.1 mandelate racemase [Xanthobacteraceae bacterium]
MRITGIDETTLVMPSPNRNANLSFAAMTASAVVVRTDVMRNGRPLVGLGFDSIGRYGHGGLARERFMPRLLAASPEAYCDANGRLDPTRAFAVMMRDEKPGGHGDRAGAVGLLDSALWDLAAKLEDKPLWRLLSERFGSGDADPAVAVYASGGHYRDDQLASLKAEITRAIDLGHTLFKIKVAGAPLPEDLRRIECALALLGPKRKLAVDFNCALDADNAGSYLDKFAEYDLAWIEEPTDPLDYQLYAEICAGTAFAIATGENVFSLADARNLLRYGGLRRDRDLLQFDVSLCYGITELVRILEMAAQAGWARRRFAPHAGHLLSLNVVAGLGLGMHETAADPDSLFGGYPADMSVENGYVKMSDVPGIGIEAHPALSTVFADLLR